MTPYTTTPRVPDRGYPVELEILLKQGTRLFFELPDRDHLFAQLDAAVASPQFAAYRVSPLEVDA